MFCLDLIRVTVGTFRDGARAQGEEMFQCGQKKPLIEDI